MKKEHQLDPEKVIYINDIIDQKNKRNNNKTNDENNSSESDYDDSNNVIEKTPEGQILDNLGLTKPCCRRHMLTHVDIN
mgnify:CR=1 FL=1